MFDEVNNWVRVIDENIDSFEISSVHRDDLEHIGYNTSQVDDGTMQTLASKLGDDYCEQLFWSSLSIIADGLGIPKKGDDDEDYEEDDSEENNNDLK